MAQKKRLNIYGGLRFEYAIIKSQVGIPAVSLRTRRITIGPVLGCEYYIGSNFTVGGEFGVKNYSLKNTQDPPPVLDKVQKTHYFITDTGLFVRFCF